MPALTDDNSVWPQDQASAPPPGGQPDPYNGYWIPRIVAGLWNTAKSGFTLPGDVATGKASMSDPQTQARVGDMASLALGAPGVAPAEAGALNAGLRRPTADQIGAIIARAAELKRGPWPQAEGSLFDTSPEAYARTTDIVPQASIRPDVPAPPPGGPFPAGGRAAPISDASSQIAASIAERLYPMVQSQDPRLMFYNTGPIYEALAKQGLDTGVVPEWAGQVAATSPRTQTPTNLRNASYLLYRRGPGQTPFTREEFNAEGNPPGYAMMGEQVSSAGRFGEGTASPNTAPKQFTFRGNVMGNLADPTIDTHNIRALLYQFDQHNPGQIPRGWFTSDEAYNDYRQSGGFRPDTPISPGAINDSLASATTGGVKRQTEYGALTPPWYEAASQLGISPAQAQSGGWFGYGGITGLRSPPRTLTQLFSDQIYDTAHTLGVAPERVLNWWSRKLIPLAQNTPSGEPATAVG